MAIYHLTYDMIQRMLYGLPLILAPIILINGNTNVLLTPPGSP